MATVNLPATVLTSSSRNPRHANSGQNREAMDAMQNPSDPAGQLDLNLDLNLGIELQDDLEGDTLREECGVFGIFGHPEAAAITALGLHALQHRGQEAAGIVSFDGSRFHSERRLGLV